MIVKTPGVMILKSHNPLGWRSSPMNTITEMDPKPWTGWRRS